MAARRSSELGSGETLNDNQILQVLEEIPSDCESVASDTESESDDELEEEVQGENISELHENVPVMQVEDEDTSVVDEVVAEDDAGDERKNIVWLKEVLTHDINEFHGDPGPNISSEKEDPIEIFGCLFEDELFEHIVYHTNLYATQKLGGSTAFKPTNADEIKKFLAINLLMGIKKCPSYKNYWSSDPALRDNYISAIMPRNRFSWLLGYIHLNDNSEMPKKGEEGYDKLYKIRPLLEMFSETYLKSYRPTKMQAIDESMIRFKGRSSIKQYMPLKPIKRGYKVWIRANSNGYISQFEIYTGKVGQTTEKCLGSRVVKTLTTDLFGKFHEVYFDNYFTSLPLMHYLRMNGVYACGTVRKHRVGLPSDFENEKTMSRGEFQFRCSEEGLVSMFWKDRKGIYFLSNYHDVTDVMSVGRRNKDGSREEITCPKLVKDYNENMGFVDKADMLKALYEVNRKSRKWWHRIFWYILDVTVVNAFIIYREQTNDMKTNLMKFRLSLVAGLIGAKTNTPTRAKTSPKLLSKFKPYVAPGLRYDKTSHMPKRGSSRRCAQCSTKKEPHRTKWFCETCEVGLCMTKDKNCFNEYHKK